MAKNLVIVESPAKAKTMGRFLGKDYVVKASMGHVRDLPERTRRGDLGVDIENDFKPRYEVPDGKKKIVAEIKSAAKGVTTIYLATDPDREGEAISWHLLQSAGLDKMKAPKKRVVFHEITKDAITRAFKHPRELDMELVDAQQARRILDRVVGYKLSPLLWKKIEMGLSAGRVQSAALRMIVDREREIQAFQAKEYWTIQANLAKLPENVAPNAIDSVVAELVKLSGVKEKIEIENDARASELTADLEGASYKVSEITRKETQRRPPAPFITSTLQQEASQRLRFTGKRTMAIAQQLYEGVTLGKEGSVALITYMRTDSTYVAPTAVHETREYIQKKFGKQYLPSAARAYTKKVMGAQEAHEAIRPISVQREPSSLAPYLDRDHLRLYELIWKRMVACQMNNAVFDSTTVDVSAASQKSDKEYVFRATGSVMKFPGFRVLYEVEKDDDDEDGKKNLPELKENEPLDCRELKPEQHFTKPPPRYTEASLIKELEENGIGRPSTYAPIISTIMDRGYVEKQDHALVPQSRGFSVSDLLIENFPDIFDLKFTADMENRLDEIASGKRKWVPFLKEFYKPFSKDLSTADKNVSDEATDQLCPEGHPMVVKVGRFGRFLACSLYPKHKYTQRIVVAKPATENINGQPSETQGEVTSELCPEGHPLVIREGKFGKFLACSKFPEHKFTKPILNKTGVLCPKDKGELVERQAFSKKLRRRVTFYGCSNYPECDFTVSQKPLLEPCPECGGLMIKDGKDGAKCTVCAYKTANEKDPDEAEPAGVEV